MQTPTNILFLFTNCKNEEFWLTSATQDFVGTSRTHLSDSRHPEILPLIVGDELVGKDVPLLS